MTEIIIRKTGQLETNSVLVGDMLFDPSGSAAEWIEFLDSRGIRPSAIYLTHGHWDHMLALRGLVEYYKIPWRMNAADLPLVNVPLPASAPLPPPDWAIETPGHSPGSVCYYLPREKLLLSGDTLFADCIGRTDFMLGDPRAMKESLVRLRGVGFPDDTRVIPGHMGETSIARLKLENLFFK